MILWTLILNIICNDNFYYLLLFFTGNKGEILETLCGSVGDLPKVIEVPGPYAYVKFKSNSAVTAKGFSMQTLANYDEGKLQFRATTSPVILNLSLLLFY